MTTDPRPTIEVLADGIAALAEIQRRLPEERVTFQFQRQSFAEVLEFLRTWFHV